MLRIPPCWHPHIPAWSQNTGSVGQNLRVKRAALLALSSLTLVTTLAGCSSSFSRSPAALRTTTTTTSGPAATTSTTSPPPFFEVTTAPVAGVGTILVNGEGFTLYMFEADNQSGESTCYDECENLWPPVLLVDGVKAPEAGAGVNPSLLGTTVRTSGPEQITYNRWPLYLWHGDTQPGEATGQGLNSAGGLWYVLNSQGVPVTIPS
jgi:predicted lipoprotein with Yx(FWY)xxD motif